MPRKNTVCIELFKEAVATSRSWMQVFKKLNIKFGGGTYLKYKKLAKSLGLSTVHMVGKGWNLGENYRHPKKPVDLPNLLIDNLEISTYKLKLRLWKENILEKRCNLCDSVEWFGRHNHLQLDHINGNRLDNRLENLRILCANCHSSTSTYCGRNIRKY